MEYDFNQLDPVRFQRLVNCILVKRFGENARLTPLRGQDGGRDGETAPGNPYFEFRINDSTPPPRGIFEPPQKGRYLFQAKHHRTIDRRLSDVRQAVVSDFAKELRDNVLEREGDESVNYFFLITNVPSSKDAIAKVDQKRAELVKNVPGLHADVWWQERLVAYLDQMPSVWISFPEIFPAGRVPLLAEVVEQMPGRLPRAVRLAIDHQYETDKNVKFRQIELEQDLSRLFVDLDVTVRGLPEEDQQRLLMAEARRQELVEHDDAEDTMLSRRRLQLSAWRRSRSGPLVSVLGLLLNGAQYANIRRIVLEGGPGQGKSTMTQMAAQIYRQQLLGKNDMDPEGRWTPPRKVRLPFRIELRKFAEWLSKNAESSVEQYLASTIKQDSGGSEITVDNIHSMVEGSPVLLVFDGLDEVGSDSLRDEVLGAILECTYRFQENLSVDLLVVITTRPPAIVGRKERLMDYRRFSIAPMESDRVERYLRRWLHVQIHEEEERERIKESFQRRQHESHVEALARNPMQLSVLLQFIRLKGEAFPDRRAELYRDYFQIVIDRDVEKSPELRKHRQVIEALHEFLGYKVHSLTEVSQADRTLERVRVIRMVEDWLRTRGDQAEMAGEFFALGEERFGLIVTPKGEGTETRYGFEIQPIQEYFAAAFISNQIPPSNAHEVFEAMIRRPYWREVALFLAGLRRPNEKADLVVRARRLDQDDDLGWRQDGRAIVLQLLAEGVFSDPPYVFSQALDLMLDLLDPRVVEVQREPESMLETLADLAGDGATREQKKRLLGLLQDYKSCDDEFLLYRLYRIASQALNSDQILGEIMSYRGHSADTTAKMRLVWPSNWGIDISKAAQEPSFWQGVSDSTWARSWWHAGFRFGPICNLPIGASLHQHLAEQFATNPFSFFQFSYSSRGYTESPIWAVWKLAQQQTMLYSLSAYKRRSMSLADDVRETIVSDDHLSADFTGLNESTQVFVHDLIRLSHALLTAMCVDEASESAALADYIKGVVTYLEEPGLTSWLACRCAINLLRTVLVERIENTMRGGAIFLATDDVNWLSLVERLRPFYASENSSDNKHGQSEAQAFDFLLSQLRLYLYRMPRLDVIPRYIQPEQKGKLVAVVDLFAKHIGDGNELPFEWMNSMVLTGDIVRPLIERSRNHLPRLLTMLSEFNFAKIDAGPSLRVQDTQRILKIARHTDDPQILIGAQIALSNAKFLRLAKPALILKLLRADSDKARFGSYLFKRGYVVQETLFGDVSPVMESREIGVIKSVARGVLQSPDEYSLQTICAAADYLAEHDRVDLPPLLAEQRRLGIQIQES